MSKRRAHNDPLTPQALDDLDEVFGSVNPNPERKGCPPREVLLALSRGGPPVGDPNYEHLTECSPCYLEFRSFQQAWARPTVLGLSRQSWLTAAAASVVLAVGGWFLLSDVGVGPELQVENTPSADAIPVDLDLRGYTVSRSEQSTEPLRPPLTLPRGVLRLTIRLPTGSEPGLYEIQLLTSDPQPLLSLTGSAEIRDFVTTIDVVADIREVGAGEYRLALRRQGETPRVYPVAVP